eukprot:Opistho-1_new@73593
MTSLSPSVLSGRSLGRAQERSSSSSLVLAPSASVKRVGASATPSVAPRSSTTASMAPVQRAASQVDEAYARESCARFFKACNLFFAQHDDYLRGVSNTVPVLPKEAEFGVGDVYQRSLQHWVDTRLKALPSSSSCARDLQRMCALLLRRLPLVRKEVVEKVVEKIVAKTVEEIVYVPVERTVERVVERIPDGALNSRQRQSRARATAWRAQQVSPTDSALSVTSRKSARHEDVSK